MKFFINILFLFAAVSCTGHRSGLQQEASVRIVSLSPSVTHTLQQMGLDAWVVGRTSYCPAPLQGNTSQVVGNVLEVNIEEVLLLQPDIVFCMAFTKEETMRKLTDLGIEVKAFDTPESFDEICAQTLEIGKWVGEEERVKAWVNEERARVEEISREALEKSASAAPVLEASARRTFFQIGDNPIFPVIEHTYMNEYLTMLGLDNVVKDYKGGGLGRETVLALQPEIMFISRMSGEGERVLDEWKQYPSIPAVTAGRLLLVDDTKACCPTPLFFRETLQTLADYLDSLP